MGPGGGGGGEGEGGGESLHEGMLSQVERISIFDIGFTPDSMLLGVLLPSGSEQHEVLLFGSI